MKEPQGAEAPKTRAVASKTPIKRKTQKKDRKKTIKIVPENNTPRKRGRPRKDEGISSEINAPNKANKSPKVSIKSKHLDLTDREERFCREYACDAALNATRAYLKAFPNNAYNSAKTEACYLLTKPYIKARVTEILEERAANLELSPTRVLQEAAKIAFLDPSDFFHGDGRIKLICEMDPDTRAALAGFETLHKITGNAKDEKAITTKIKFPDKLACLEMLFRYFKMLSDRTPAPAKQIADLLTKVLSGELTAREAAFQLQIAGIAIPEILKLELQADKEEGDGYDPGPTAEELERRYLEGIAATEKQRLEFLPIRKQEVAELKESLAHVNSFKPE